VNVERRPVPQLEEVVRHDLAVGGEHQAIGAEARDRVARLAGPEASRGEHPQSRLARPRTDGGRAQLKPAPRRSIGLADDEHLIGDLGHAGQQRNAECAGAEKRDPPDAH